MAKPRFSIIGLMGIVLVASLALAALHEATESVAQVVSLLTGGVMILAAIAAVFGPREERAWWLGVLLFGMGPTEPLDGLLKALLTHAGVAAFGDSRRPFVLDPVDSQTAVGHCILRLLVATLGGALGRLCFGSAAQAADPLRGETVVPPPRSRACEVIAGAGLLIMAASVVVWSQTVPAYWTGWVLLATWGLIGLAALGALCDRATPRVRWTGAALFGGGYLLSTFGLSTYEGPTVLPFRIDEATRGSVPGLAFVEPGFPTTSAAVAAANTQVRKALEQRVTIHCPRPATLEEALAYVVSVTRLPDGNRLPIHVSPVGLNEAETTMQATVDFDVENAPLASSLRRLLEPLGLGYWIEGGLVEITDGASVDESANSDPRIFAIHCALALLAAGLGAVLAPLAAGLRSKPRERGETGGHRRLAAGVLVMALLASLGLAGLQSVSPKVARVMDLGTAGVLSLAVVGLFCSEERERAWWLGFVVFGKGYLVLALDSGFWISGSQLYTPEAEDPPGMLLKALHMLLPRSTAGSYPLLSGIDISAWTVPHCLATLLAAALGGGLAVLYFGATTRPKVGGRHEPLIAARGRHAWISPIVAIGLLGVVVAAVVRSQSLPSVWTGAALLATWALIGMAVLAAAVGQGKRRLRAIGAAVFGCGYMLIVAGSYYQTLPSWVHFRVDDSLRALFPYLEPVERALPEESEEIAGANARIRRALEQTVPTHFAHETPLEDFLSHVAERVRLPDGRRLPIFVDPIGLNEAEKTIRSPVQLELDGVPLETSLRLMLRQIGMTYEIHDGLLQISSEGCRDYPCVEDSRLIAGQLVLALMAAGLGAVLAPLVAGGEMIRGRDS